MGIDFDPLLEVKGCSNCQPDGHVGKYESNERVDEHVPSPVVPEPPIYSDEQNGEHIPADEQDQAMGIEIFPLAIVFRLLVHPDISRLFCSY